MHRVIHCVWCIVNRYLRFSLKSKKNHFRFSLICTTHEHNTWHKHSPQISFRFSLLKGKKQTACQLQSLGRFYTFLSNRQRANELHEETPQTKEERNACTQKNAPVEWICNIGWCIAKWCWCWGVVFSPHTHNLINQLIFCCLWNKQYTYVVHFRWRYSSMFAISFHLSRFAYSIGYSIELDGVDCRIMNVSVCVRCVLYLDAPHACQHFFFSLLLLLRLLLLLLLHIYTIQMK